MNEFWDVLEVTGDMEEAQILFAHIKDYALGSIEEDKKIKVYTSKNSKNKINMLINNLNFDNNLHLSWDTIKNENWHLMWKKYFTPVEINNVIEILPDWDYDNSSHKDKIYIRPGMSFGTGHHETTYLMIQALVEYSKKLSSFLDLGSGSGILSIAGEKLGYRDIHAVEFDLECKNDFKFNVNMNNCSENINITWIDVLEWENFNFDIILANIEKNIIKKIITNVKKTDARFIFSGLLKEDEMEMTDHLLTHNFVIEKITSKNEWIAIDCKKNEN